MRERERDRKEKKKAVSIYFYYTRTGWNPAATTLGFHTKTYFFSS